MPLVEMEKEPKTLPYFRAVKDTVRMTIQSGDSDAIRLENLLLGLEQTPCSVPTYKNWKNFVTSNVSSIVLDNKRDTNSAQFKGWIELHPSWLKKDGQLMKMILVHEAGHGYAVRAGVDEILLRMAMAETYGDINKARGACENFAIHFSLHYLQDLRGSQARPADSTLTNLEKHEIDYASGFRWMNILVSEMKQTFMACKLYLTGTIVSACGLFLQVGYTISDIKKRKKKNLKPTDDKQHDG